MEFFESITDWLVQWLLTIGIDKTAVRALFESWGLMPLWELFRSIYLNPYIFLFAVPLLVILARIWPAEKRQSLKTGHVALDFLYPLFALPIQATLIVALISIISSFFEQNLPFLDTGLVDGQPLVVQGIAAVVIADLMFWVAHWLKHKIPWLWYFHTIHHSQRHLGPLTTFRNHPFEDVFNVIIRTVPIAVIGGSRPSWFLFALFDAMWGFYIHSNIRTNLGPLKYVLVTPQNHRLHHTIEPDQIDRNFGERLTIWDWLFGTLHKGFDDYPKTGVRGIEWIEETSARPSHLVKAWVFQFVYPFWMIGKDIRRATQRLVATDGN